MLVLSRKAGQRIHIGDDIVVEVRRVAGNRVTIALEAPRDVRILRGELQQAATEFEIEDEAETYPVTRGVAPRIAELTTHIASSEMVG
ncbi:carbon storage regulator [Aeoliella sp.]|uniref:carbon storage regulator n=1 Tax=Aeoliella sp. TaxID=2795800 RepID=UPI003CCBAB71